MYAGSCAKQFEIAIIHVSTFPDINTVVQNVHSIRITIILYLCVQFYFNEHFIPSIMVDSTLKSMKIYAQQTKKNPQYTMLACKRLLVHG